MRRLGLADRAAGDRAGRESDDEILRRAGLPRGDLDPLGRLVHACVVSEVSPGAEERRSRVQEQVAAPGLRSLSLQFAAENGQLLEPTQVEHRFESPHAGVRDHLREAASARELEHAIVALERGPRPVNQVLQQPHVPVGDSGVSAAAPGGTEQSRLPNVLHAVHVPEVEPRQPAVPESRRRPLHAELLRDGERTFRAHEPTLRITADRPAPALRLERVEELRTARAVLDQCHRLVDHLAEVAAEMHVHPRERNHRACRRPEIPLFPEPRHRPLEQRDRFLDVPAAGGFEIAGAIWLLRTFHPCR